MSITAPFEDLVIKKLRRSDALIADYSTDFVYRVTPQSCDCDEFQRSHNCIHMRFYQHCCIPARRKKAFVPLKIILAGLVIFLIIFALNKDLVYNSKARAIYKKDANVLQAAFKTRAAIYNVNYRDLTLTNYARNDGTYTISFVSDDKYANKDEFLETMYSLYGGVCHDVYLVNKYINKVTFNISTNLKDPSGKVTTTKVMTISVPRAEFDSYNWADVREDRDVFDIGIDGHVKRYPGIGDTPYPAMKDHKFF